MFVSVETPDLAQALCDAVIAARFEVLAFCFAVAGYSILASKRIPRNDLLQKTAKLQEQPPSPRTAASVQASAKSRTPPDVMIRKYASEKNLKGAENIFQSLKESGVEINSVVYNTMIDACVTCHDLQAAYSWMEQARQAGMVDVVSYNTIMKAHLMNNDFEKARGIFMKMKHAGTQPSCVTFNELINAMVKRGGKKDNVWEVVKEMREVGTSPNQVTCSILLKDLNSWSSDAEIQKTMDLLDAITEPLDEVMISSVVEACVRIGKPELLANKLEQLQEAKRLSINSSHTFGSLIKAYGQAHDLQGVWRNWKAMRTQLIKPSSITLGCMVEALQNNACTEDAFDLVQQLQEDPQCRGAINAVTYCSILKGFAREKKLERVLEIYQEMERRQVEMPVVTFNTVLDACARVGRMEHAARIMQDMQRHRLEPNIVSYSTVLKGHCQAGDIELAFSILNQMRKQAGLKPDEIMYNSLIDGCAQHGLYTEGMQVFDEMMQDGVRPSNFTLSILVKLMNRSRKVDQAFSVVEEMSQKYGLKPNVYVYTNLIQACVSNRRHDRALTVLETMVKERVQPDQRTYGVLIRASIFQNQPEQAAALLRTALGLPGALEVLADSRFAGCPDVDSKFVNKTLSSLAERGSSRSLIAPLLADLKKSKHRIHIDPEIQRMAIECFR